VPRWKVGVVVLLMAVVKEQLVCSMAGADHVVSLTALGEDPIVGKCLCL
jgi:hypothetical protein